MDFQGQIPMETAPGAARELQSGTSVLMEQLSACGERLRRGLRHAWPAVTFEPAKSLVHRPMSMCTHWPTRPLHASQPVTFDLTRAMCVLKGGTLSYVTKAAIEATWQLEWERFSTHGAERGLLAESRRAGLYQW